MYCTCTSFISSIFIFVICIPFPISLHKTITEEVIPKNCKLNPMYSCNNKKENNILEHFFKDIS